MAKTSSAPSPVLDAIPDTVDFRDRLYVPTLVEVPPVLALDDYRSFEVPILNQGTEGACTGFGLATVANYLLRKRARSPDVTPVSARMLYEMARRYDEWPGEDYSGSSARGAIKGWHKHGVCAEDDWRYVAGRDPEGLTAPRAAEALKRPLGAYFRVNHKDLVAMHSAISEVGVLYATAKVHRGWQKVDREGRIPYTEEPLGGHAFAIVAYDRDGFWLQNSWGGGWGRGGFARVGYADWLQNGFDIWVVRLGAPIELGGEAQATASLRSAAPQAYESYVNCALRPHVVTIGNDGALRSTGTFALDRPALSRIVRKEIREKVEPWTRKRVVLYAHGGLVAESAAVQRIADYREAFLSAEAYPLSFIWRSDLWTTVTNILTDALRRRRPEEPVGAALDYLLDRVDDMLEPVARAAGGKELWDEMKENATLATAAEKGAARLVAGELAGLAGDLGGLELHVVAHSAGAIFMAPLVQLLATRGAIRGGPMKGETGLGLNLASVTLWAPACSIKLFDTTYRPLIKQKRIDRARIYTLSDAAERDDHCARIYNKSLLYLVSNALERVPRLPLEPSGAPLLGLARDIAPGGKAGPPVSDPKVEWIVASDQGGSRSTARRHGDFDDDKATLASTLAFITEGAASRGEFEFHASPGGKHDHRRALGLDTASGP